MSSTAKGTVGFIGLGIMGAPMARNLVKAGYTVTGHIRKPGAGDALVEAGGKTATTIADTINGVDTIITMLPDSPDVEDVVTGPDGILAHAKPGQLLIDMSSIRPDVTRTLAATVSDAGLDYLDAPVSGGEAAAIEGSLSIMVGGDPDVFAKAGPVLEALGATVVHVGPSGSGQTVKAANQLIVAGNIQLLAEALVFLEASGVDAEPALRVLGGGLAGSTVLNRKAEAMRTRNFAPGFRLNLHNKDLGIVTAAAREAGIVIPLGAAVAQLVAALVARGDGTLDHSALFKLTAELSGHSLD